MTVCSQHSNSLQHMACCACAVENRWSSVCLDLTAHRSFWSLIVEKILEHSAQPLAVVDLGGF